MQEIKNGEIVKSKHKSYTWVIQSPGVGGVAGPRLGTNLTVTRIDAFTTSGTSVIFNIEERSSIGVSGTDLMVSDLTATTSGDSITSSFNLSSLVSGRWLWIDISAVNGSPSYLTITLTVDTT